VLLQSVFFTTSLKNQLTIFQMMKIYYLLIILTCLFNCAPAQVAQPAASDTINMSPNTVRIRGQVISSEKNTAILKVLEVVAYGSGISNIVSEGQQLTIRIPEGDTQLSANGKVEADLKEKIGVDASTTSYSLLRAKKIDR
jgi:hypothetical protein